MMQETTADPLTKFRRINVQGTLIRARQAVAAGVQCFVFISSIGVNGAETFRRSFASQDVAAPHSPYAVSEYETELRLQVLAAEPAWKWRSFVHRLSMGLLRQEILVR